MDNPILADRILSYLIAHPGPQKPINIADNFRKVTVQDLENVLYDMEDDGMIITHGLPEEEPGFAVSIATDRSAERYLQQGGYTRQESVRKKEKEKVERKSID